MTSRVGYAAGAFDLFHIGHLNLLRRSRERCDYLIAGVVSDDICQVTKGRRPIVPLDERLEIVRHITFVDSAVAELHIDRLNTWAAVRFDIFFKGSDWQGTEKGRKLERAFSAVGVEVVYLPYTVHTSSSTLRKALETLNSGHELAVKP